MPFTGARHGKYFALVIPVLLFAGTFLLQVLFDSKFLRVISDGRFFYFHG